MNSYRVYGTPKSKHIQIVKFPLVSVAGFEVKYVQKYHSNSTMYAGVQHAKKESISNKKLNRFITYQRYDI